MSRRVPYETLAADPIERDATTKGSAPLKADRVRKGISPRVAFQVIEKEEEHEGGGGRERATAVCPEPLISLRERDCYFFTNVSTSPELRLESVDSQSIDRIKYICRGGKSGKGRIAFNDVPSSGALSGYLLCFSLDQLLFRIDFPGYVS